MKFHWLKVASSFLFFLFISFSSPYGLHRSSLSLSLCFIWFIHQFSPTYLTIPDISRHQRLVLPPYHRRNLFLILFDLWFIWIFYVLEILIDIFCLSHCLILILLLFLITEWDNVMKRRKKMWRRWCRDKRGRRDAARWMGRACGDGSGGDNESSDLKNLWCGYGRS